MLTRRAWNEARPGLGIVYSALVLSRGTRNEGNLGLVLHTGAHRSHSANLKLHTGAHGSHSANLELVVSQPLERHILQFLSDKYKYIVSRLGEPGNEVNPGLVLRTGAH